MIRDLSYILVSAVIVFSAILGYNYVTEQQQNNLRYTSGTYTVSAEGYHGPVELAVTFDSVSIKNIEIVKEEETAEIGHVAIPVVIDRIMKAQGGGINAVTGATVTSMAVVNAVCNAASEAGVSNLAAFKSKRAKKIKEHKVEDTWDIVIVGGGGAGLAAAAQAAQDGNTVLVIEKNADLGGNTVISGGSYQCVTPYLVWNKEDPDATEAMGYDGKMHRKVNATNGNIATLKILLDWNEEPFDEEYYKTHEFEAGNEIELSKHGVHSEYLPVLKALKEEIRAYLAYADKEMKKGKKENQLTLFSTTNLHIFQTYYGGLRQSFDKTEYIYGQVDLVSQFITEGIDLQPWFMNMGVEYNDVQTIIVGGLWQRAINMRGANITLNGKEEYYQGKLGAYVMAPYAATLNANAHNRIMTQTSAEDLIVKDGRVVGVHASGEDGTKLTAYARKGVIVATGGYAANIKKVVETNKYWSKDDLLPSTKTTNRSSLQGDGIWMAEAVGAGVTGMGWTQLLPLSYAETGNIAFGSVEAAAIISPVTGERYIDELSERDVLSWAAFKNGVELFGTRGSFLYFCPAMVGDGYMPVLPDVPNNQYTLKLSEIPAVTKALGLNTDTDKLIETIRDFDQSVINNTPFKNVSHKYRTLPIGHIEMNADRSFNKKTYDIDNYPVMMRILAPATHHTMGGLTIDMQRHVLDTEGNIIPGLYAAGEVTGGIHGGNRLGGNAITEVLVSGRIAAKAANQE